MSRTKKSITIPIVEAHTNRVVGGFCSDRDAVSSQELQALAHLKQLRLQADQVKSLLKKACGTEKMDLDQKLDRLRKEASIWRKKREQATREKNIALGHVILPVE